MRFSPVSRNADPTADPHAVVLQHMVKHGGERAGALRAANEARVQANRHQRGVAPPSS